MAWSVAASSPSQNPRRPGRGRKFSTFPAPVLPFALPAPREVLHGHFCTRVAHFRFLFRDSVPFPGFDPRRDLRRTVAAHPPRKARALLQVRAFAPAFPFSALTFKG